MEGSGSGFHGFQRVPASAASSSGLKVTAGDSSNQTGENNGHDEPVEVVREQDRYMPITNVVRIMRRILPSHAKISDEAKEMIQECVSEFISFVTSEANVRCQMQQRKTITAEDLIWAMEKLGFDDYIAPLTLYLNRYREFEGERNSIRNDYLVKNALEMAQLNDHMGYGPVPAGGFHIPSPHQGGLAIHPPCPITPSQGGFTTHPPHVANESKDIFNQNGSPSNSHGQPQDFAHAHTQAQDLAHAQAQAQAQAQASIQAQAHDQVQVQAQANIQAQAHGQVQVQAQQMVFFYPVGSYR